MNDKIHITKPKVSYCGSLFHFERDLERNKKTCAKFKVINSGQQAYIEKYGIKYKYFGSGSKEDYIKGIFIAKMVHRDLDDYIITNGAIDFNMFLVDNNITYFVSKDNFKKFENEVINSFDINHCYWRTAYLAGYIKEKTYLKGISNNEYKEALHIILGSLARTQYISEYEYDREIKRYSEYANINYAAFWHKIKELVYKLFIEFKTNFPNDLLMFKTDCFYFNPEITTKVIEFLTKKGYTSKYNSIIVRKVDEYSINYYDNSLKKELMVSYGFPA